MPIGTAKLSVSPNNGYPGFSANNKHYFPAYFEKGNTEIEFNYEYGEDIVFKLIGKRQEEDTTVVNGKVVGDKYIIIESINLDYTQVKETHFHQFFFDPFFGINEEEKILHIPNLDEFPKWALKLQVT